MSEEAEAIETQADIDLWVFWRHDQYPFLLGGVASKMNADGTVYVESYQGCFNPVRFYPKDIGRRLDKRLMDLRAEYRKAKEDLLVDFEKQSQRIVLEACRKSKVVR